MLYIGREEAVNMPLELATSGSWCVKEHVIYGHLVQRLIGGIWVEVLFWLSVGMMDSIDLYHRLRQCSGPFFPR